MPSTIAIDYRPKPPNPRWFVALAILISLCVVLFFIPSCNLPKYASKQDVLTYYRATYGDNWDNWTPETVSAFKRDIEPFTRPQQ